MKLENMKTNILTKVNIKEKLSFIKKINFKDKRVIAAILIAFAVILVITISLFSRPKPKVVNTSVVNKKTLVQYISVTGNIEAKETDKTLLSTTQKVIDALVSEGQDVKKGTVLVKLDTADYEYQLKKAELNLNMTQLNIGNGRRTTSNSVKLAEMALEKAKGDYNQVKSKFDANQILYDNGYISKFDYEASKKALADGDTGVKNAEISLQNTKNTLSDYDGNISNSSQKGQLELIKADIDNLNNKLENSTIKANIDGKVVKLDAVKGQYPKLDSNTVMVCDTSLYKVIVSVSQYDAITINIDQKVNIKVKGSDMKYNGTVSSIGQFAQIVNDGASKQPKVEIEIIVNNPDETIKVGYEVDADITIKEKVDALAINFDSIKQDGNGKKYVFIAQNNKAVKRYIETGIETDFDVEILSGLSEGDNYIASPPEKLLEGDPIALPGGKK